MSCSSLRNSPRWQRHLPRRIAVCEQNSRKLQNKRPMRHLCSARNNSSGHFSRPWERLNGKRLRRRLMSKSEYPEEGDHCLLCERSFDEVSKTHVAALLSFVEGDAQRKAEMAALAVQRGEHLLQELDLKIFAPESRVREHVHRIDPHSNRCCQHDNIDRIGHRKGHSVAAGARHCY